ncbi:hypothetical protein V7056_06185 [Bacillus sp. JJ664]
MDFGRHPRPHRPTPPPGLGGRHFAHITNSGGVIAVLNEGTDATFSSFQNIGEEITINETNDRLTVEHPGNYLIIYSVNTTTETTLSTRLLVNRRPVDATTITPVISRTQYNNQIILPLETGDTISLQLFGIVGLATLGTGAGATLTIFKLH